MKQRLVYFDLKKYFKMYMWHNVFSPEALKKYMFEFKL